MDTKLIIAFAAGLFVGWLLEWVIDWLYWRRKYRKENAALQNENERLKADHQFLQSKISDLENQTLISQSAFKDEISTEDLKDPVKKGDRDDLTRIKGIGPAIERKLNDAGVYTFAQLGALTPAKFEEIVGEDIKRLADEEQIIMRTNVLTGQAPSDKLQLIKGIGPKIETKLNDAGIYTFAALAALTPAQLEEIVGEEIKRLADEEEILQQAASLAAKLS